jgi:adenine-specific DNA-methyltransferase
VVNSILGKNKFKNPKDHEILAELFNLVTWRDKNSIILDAYAGSGTTGHSVITMNAEDLGNRRFILIEQGDPKAKHVSRERYATDITAERIRRVISGQWDDGKDHPQYDTGFHFFKANKRISKNAIMASTRESLADIILQVVEEESNRIDFRFEGHTYLIGRTRLGYGIALVWGSYKSSKSDQILNWEVLNTILDEADKTKVSSPIHVYASANTAPINDDLYRFHQIPDSILAKLGILSSEEEEEA